MNILRQTPPAVRVWTLDTRPRAPFVRRVAWSLDHADRPAPARARALPGFLRRGA